MFNPARVSWITSRRVGAARYRRTQPTAISVDGGLHCVSPTLQEEQAPFPLSSYYLRELSFFPISPFLLPLIPSYHRFSPNALAELDRAREATVGPRREMTQRLGGFSGGDVGAPVEGQSNN